jgi:hypothetical protein
MAEVDDIREITDLTANLSRMRQKAGEAQLEMTREMQTLAMDHAKNMRKFDDEQMSFLKKVGAQRTYELREELDIEQRVIQQRMGGNDLQEQDLELLGKRLEVVQGITSLTDQYSEALVDQASWMAEGSDSMFDMARLASLLVNINVERETLSQNIAEFDQDQLNAQLEKLDALERSVTVAQDYAKQIQRSKDLTQQSSNVWGVTREQAAEKFRDISAMLTNIPFLLTAGALAATRTLNSLRTEARLSVGQTLAFGDNLLRGWSTTLQTGVIVGLGDAAEIVGSLTQQFGRLDLISSELIAKQARLTKVFGLSGDESAGLLEILETIGEHSDQFTSDTTTYVENLARANDLPIGQLMSAVAKQTANFALAGREGALAIIEATAAAQKLGLEMDQINQFARQSVLSPDTFIQNITRLRMFGIQMADPIGLLALANDPRRRGELVQRLAQTFAGMDLRGMDEITRARIEDTFGMPFEEIMVAAQRYERGEELGTQLEDAAKGAISPMQEQVENLAASLMNFTSGLTAGTFALAALTAAAALKAGGLLRGGGGGGLLAQMTGGGLAAGGGRMAGLGRLAGGAARFAPIAGGALMTGLDVAALAGGRGGAGNIGGIAGAVAGGAIGALGGPIGIGIGSMIGNVAGKFIGGMFEQPTAARATERAAYGAARPHVPGGAAPMTVMVDTVRLELKLDELIGLFRSTTSSK